MGRATRVLCDGIYFGEAPRWREGRLWFSDFFAHAVKSVSLAGDVRTEFEIDDRPSGLGWMPDGSLLIVSMTKRRLLRRSASGNIGVHAELGGIADFHCNDMVVDSVGRAYVGNFGFDLYTDVLRRSPETIVPITRPRGLPACSPTAPSARAAAGMHFPNGTVITPDGKALIVGESLSGNLVAFDVAEDGVLSNRRVWASLWPRIPDGITLDANGHIWGRQSHSRRSVSWWLKAARSSR